MSKAPIANGTAKAAASGPSASKSHGAGEAFKAPKSNPGRQPNTSLVTESIGSHDGSEKTQGGGNILGHQGNSEFGTGKTAPAKSNNDVSSSPAPK
jgi:hypothetical protein